ncbi:MAG: DUF362 domain-containing protein [Lachnospiraceae bacterium]|nr:DUF362 domain-containing protein [Lachnospiraceae bacterium]
MIQMPELIRVRQNFCRDKIENVEKELKQQLIQSGIRICKGEKIAIAVGSRGIANLPLIVKTTVDWVKERGAKPFIVPAMGSHGNGIASEQTAILNGLGITEASVGAEIHSSMEVVELPQGDLDNHVYIDKNAYEADGTIVINRVKIHGDFVGETESGLLKMCVIGLGKHKQALEIHSYDISRLRELIVGTAKQVLRHGNIIGGIGIVENAYHETMILQAVLPEDFEEAEIAMLKKYKEIMPKFPVEEFDILIVDEIGKEISGAGMETKIVGRMKSGAKEPESPRIRYIVTTDLTKASHGNACGVGIADFITRKLFDKIDLPATNENIVTCRCIEQGRIPLIAEHDRQAVEYAIRALGNKKPEDIKIIRIKNTLQMDKLYMSENLLEEAGRAKAVNGVGNRKTPIFREGESQMIPFENLEEQADI